MTVALFAALVVRAGAGAVPATAETAEVDGRCASLVDAPAAPFAARHLLVLHRLRDWAAPGLVEACVDRLLDARGAPRSLLRQAAALRATWAWEAGNDDRARAEASRAGLVTAWEIAGPFGDPRRGVLAGGGTVDQAVETLRVDPGSSLQGRHGAVAFRPLPAPRADGVIDVGRAVPPREGSCALLRATIDPGRLRRPALLLGGAAALTVWVDPRWASAASTTHEIAAARGGESPERAAVDLGAPPGPLLVLVAVCPGPGPTEIRIAVDEAPDGGTDAERADRRVASAAGPARKAAELLDAAELLVESGALPESADPLAGLAASVPEALAGRAALLAARSAVTGPERLAAAEQAAVLLPGGLEPLLAVAREGAALPGAPGAAAAIAAAARLAPTSSRAAAALARAKRNERLPLAALAALAAFAGNEAVPLGVRRQLVQDAQALARAPEVREQARAIVALRPRDAEAWSWLVDAEVAAGEYAAVRERLAGEPFAGEAPSTALARLGARTLLRLGDVAAAVERLQRLADERPADETAWFDLGWALVRAGREEEGARALRAGLALRPSDAAARAWIAAQEGVDPDVERWLARADDLAAAISETDRAFPDAPAAYVFRGTAVTVDAAGTVRQRERRVLLVRTPAGAERLSSIPLASFDPERTVFRVLDSTVRAADGRPKGGAGVAYSGSDVPEIRLFSQARLASLVPPRLVPGDVLEMEFELVDVVPASLPPGALAREIPVRDVFPTRLLRVAAAVPDDRTPYLHAPDDAGGVVADVGTRGGRTVAAWEARDVPAVVAEAFSPPVRELAGAVRLTTFGTWDEVAAWIGGLFRRQAADRRVAALAEGGIPATIYRQVASAVRYVAAEYGSHGLEPDAPAVTLARGYGDCKDKVALLVAALGAAGIDALPTLVRSRLAGDDPARGSFAFPYAFDHVVAWLPPPVDRYVDPTATRLPWDVLPRSDRGALGLVLDPDGPRQVVLPADAPPDERTDRSDVLILDPTGEATLIGELNAGGADAGDLRELLAAPDLRAGMMSAILERDLPDVRILAVEVQGIAPDSGGLRVGYVGAVPAFARVAREGLETPAGVRLDLVERFAALERRSTALDLGGAGFPLRTRREVEVGLSGGWIWTGIPDDARESGPFGEFLMTVRPEGGTLRVTVDLAISVVRVAPVDYVEFRGFLARVDAALSRRTLAVRRFPVR